jgi:protoporphyrinogen oxidase
MNPESIQPDLKGRHIGIVGAGITGLTSAFYLLRAGARVTVLESGSQVGGLATHFNFGPFSWDKFYHCVLTSDTALLKLIDDLSLTSELRWTETKTGFFVGQSLYSMSSALDFLKFPPLNLWQKLRLGLGILYAARVRDGLALEKRLASEWLIRIFGLQNYRRMWGPLLKCKLGACREETSAAFIWTYIARYYSTREKTASQKEKLGYVAGGYRIIFSRLIEEITRMGGEILTNAPVKNLVTSSDGGIEVTIPSGQLNFDKVIATIPSRPFAEVTPQLTPSYVRNLKEVKYLGVVCFALLLKRKLSPYYVLNLTEEDLPFTGVIEMTNLISREETAGYHLVYIPKYTVPDDPLFNAPESELWESFRAGLKRVCPDLQDSDIEQRHLFRERLVQPVPVLNYSELVPSMQTNVPSLFLANTTQIINSNLNNNAMVKIANRAVDMVRGDLSTINAAGSEKFRMASLAECIPE